jgi:small nuclear ribonucleoprotein (snRNP)-like protein
MTEVKSSLFTGTFMATLTDGRKLYGQINCLDRNGNVVFGDVVVELPGHWSSPLNKAVEITNDLRDSKEKVYRRVTNRKETEGVEWESFWTNRFYTSGFIIPRKFLAELREVDTAAV